MRFKIVPALACAFVCLWSTAGFAQSVTDQADNYLGAYRAFQKGGELETAGDRAEALRSFQEAARRLEEIRKAAPGWQPSIIEFREKKTANAISRLQQKAAPAERVSNANVSEASGAQADMFLLAFQAFQKAAQQEAAGDRAQALLSYADAGVRLEEIKKGWPAWNPSIIQFRETRIAEAIARLQPKEAPAGGAPGATPEKSEQKD
jgi:hypothetical protein